MSSGGRDNTPYIMTSLILHFLARDIRKVLYTWTVWYGDIPDPIYKQHRVFDCEHFKEKNPYCPVKKGGMWAAHIQSGRKIVIVTSQKLIRSLLEGGPF